jgi:hypothetical protein
MQSVKPVFPGTAQEVQQAKLPSFTLASFGALFSLRPAIHF